jgi:hypothetical protein
MVFIVERYWSRVIPYLNVEDWVKECRWLALFIRGDGVVLGL